MILCDIGLPGTIDGYGFASLVKREARLRTAHLVAVTGYGQKEDRRRSLRAGFDTHVTKPIDPTTLETILRARSSSGSRRAD